MRRELTDRLKAEAIRLGFDAIGVAPAVVAPATPTFSAGWRTASPAGWIT